MSIDPRELRDILILVEGYLRADDTGERPDPGNIRRYLREKISALLAVPSPSTDGGDGEDNNAPAGAAPRPSTAESLSAFMDRLRSESFTNGDTDIRWQAADEIEHLLALLKPTVGWLKYAYGNVQSVTSTAVKAHLPKIESALAGKAASSPTNGVTNER